MRKLTQEEFVERLSKINENIEVIGAYIDSHTPVLCRCKIDGYEWYASPTNLTHKNNPTGCPICNRGSNAVMVGKNDLFTTHPHIASMLKDKTIGYERSYASTLRTDWICPKCGSTIYDRSIDQVAKFGLACPYCSDYISFSEKYALSMLRQLNYDFEMHKIFSWSNRKEYDFYIKNYKNGKDCILEMHGAQHYTEKAFFKESLKYQQENDKQKMQMAQDNNITYYFQINCFYSKADWIRDHIIESGFLTSSQIEQISWDECEKYALNSSGVIEACNLKNQGNSDIQISKCLKQSIYTIKKYLKRGEILGLL